jgi:seryl-tRNA synthetase
MKCPPKRNVKICRAVVPNTFNPCAWKAEAGRSLSLRPAWSTEQVPGQLGRAKRESLSQKRKREGKKGKKEREREREREKREEKKKKKKNPKQANKHLRHSLSSILICTYVLLLYTHYSPLVQNN